ncbi:hypothetical protein M514_03813 [Trichuris suis]|uniref:Uncharacterized protein n=1 Tax=Trichuris suis TaxID=68888 RepID=A0A085MD76_9BILA|nr:hypothetical protein M513_03813 [Trichuris suis]KFD65423.1 hypothetical protein M514_03813 [Trichuris suis]
MDAEYPAVVANARMTIGYKGVRLARKTKSTKQRKAAYKFDHSYETQRLLDDACVHLTKQLQREANEKRLKWPTVAAHFGHAFQKWRKEKESEIGNSNFDRTTRI